MRKIQKLTVRLLFIILLFFFSFFCSVYYKSDIMHSYLRINSPIKSELLILEGWLQPELDKKILNVLSESNYEHILITSHSTSPSVFIYTNGYIVIKSPVINPGYYTVNSTLLGTYAKGEYAKCKIYKNDSLISDYECIKTSSHEFECNLSMNDSIVYQFYNDAHNKPKDDRNISLLDVQINDNPIDLYNGNTWVYMFGKSFHVDYRTVSERLAKRLIQAGVSKNKITTLSTSTIKLSKTYNYASASCTWMKENNYSSANVLSGSFHARRTMLSYKKAAPEYNFGILSLDIMPSNVRLLKEFIGNPLLRITPRFILERNLKK